MAKFQTKKMQKRAWQRGQTRAKQREVTQERLRREAAAKAEAERKEQARQNKIASVLGLVGAMGHNNVLQTASILSKTTRSNVLTNMLQKKRIAYEKNQLAKRFEPPNPLHLAIQAKDVEAVKKILLQKNRKYDTLAKVYREPKLSLENQLYGKDTALELALSQFGDRPRTNEETEARERSRVIVELLVEGGSKLRKQVAFKLWNLDYADIVYLLKHIPKFRNLTLVYFEELMSRLQNERNELLSEMRDYRYEPVPAHLIMQDHDVVDRLVGLEFFERTYDPRTGEFNLVDPEENNNNTNFSNENNNAF